MGLLSAILLACILIVAIADHRSKAEQRRRASVANWFCAHRGIRCDEAKSEAIEDRWEVRERFYEAAAGIMVIIGSVAFLLPAMRRHRSSG